jgi:hypothetical protein
MGRVIELLDGLILADSGATEESRTASDSRDGSSSDNHSEAPPWP